ncbi:NADH:flavin oxidoreductase [Croceicoccus bisphenolivorans]|uniref:oxidoreductase n=1 Tax=Croceicoccus bisphenolivorans TaxID=1783232 RepID=UPI000A481AEB|nr:NADH:flavin oxidoreductase [Croceicoccus bisphenolivorans]
MNTNEILSRPISIGGHIVKNRIAQGPMAVLDLAPDGSPTAQTIAFLEERARGGVGLMILSGAISGRRVREETPYGSLDVDAPDRFTDRLSEILAVTRPHGVIVFCEIVGGFGRMGVPRHGPTIAASGMEEDAFPEGVAVPGGKTMPTPHEATVEQIRQVQEDIAQTALRLKDAGADGVEMAAHMSYFEASFLTPRTNRRTDRYGGSVTNRARMLVETRRLIREYCGPDFPVGLRMTCSERIAGGQGAEEYAAIAREVEREGLAYVALSVGCYENMRAGSKTRTADVIGSGDTAAFRKALSCPILLTGLHDPSQAAAAIESGLGDISMLARPLLADPQYANKVMEGRADEIVRCNECNYCLRRLMVNVPMRCAVNAQMGREGRQGSPPPLRRAVERPIELAKLAVASSRTVMAVVMKFAG